MHQSATMLRSCRRRAVRTLSGRAGKRSSLFREAEPEIRLQALKEASIALQHLRHSLDAHVVGHQDVKEAMLLGVLAKEHVYVEGSPGSAKTMMSEIISESTDLEPFFYQMHRDTRLAELVGDSVIVKLPHESGGEVIRQDIIRGGILTAEVCVLDDISRAPGEALNVLLRILNERKFGSSSELLPLISAIASSNPASEDAYYAEPLDPANLDRFTLQVRAEGLVQKQDWSDAERVIDLYGLSHADVEDMEVRKIGREVVINACELVPHVLLAESPKRVLLKLLRILKDEHSLDESNSLLTDRTFLVKAVRVMKANAVLNGRFRCESADLRVLRFLTTFRVPPSVHAEIEEIIERIIQEENQPQTPPPPPPSSDELPNDGNAGNGNDGGGDDFPTEMPRNQAEPPSNDPSDKVQGKKKQLPRSTSQKKEKGQKEQEENQMKPREDANKEDGNSLGPGDELQTTRAEAENIEGLLKQLRGHIDRGSADEILHLGGSPRGWSRGMDSFSMMQDWDETRLATWLDSPSPVLPKARNRTRLAGGGRLAIVRDTSESMHGLWSDWSCAVSARVIDLAKQRRMRVGYAEFDANVNKFHAEDGRFFSRDYSRLQEQISGSSCSGYTNFESALSSVLNEFRKPQGLSGLAKETRDQHILFITDGEPNFGDLRIQKEIKLASKMVSVHTLFIGYEKCPTVLDTLSERTQGSKFAAFFDVHKDAVVVVDRKTNNGEFFFDVDSPRVEDMKRLKRLRQVPVLFTHALKKMRNESLS